jgi:hypothetical protein
MDVIVMLVEPRGHRHVEESFVQELQRRSSFARRGRCTSGREDGEPAWPYQTSDILLRLVVEIAL